MNETLRILLAGLAGFLLGAIFFGGLWWTVRKSIASERPGPWLIVSLLIRTSIALAGFFFVGRAHWQLLVACSLGFFVARPAAIWLTRPRFERRASRANEVRHAP